MQRFDIVLNQPIIRNDDTMALITRTASDFKSLVRSHDTDSVAATDRITCATMSVMESVSAELSITLPDGIPDGYIDTVSLNGILVTPDMIRDGHLDCMVLADAARYDGYGVGHLFRDIVKGDDIEIVVVSDDREYRACARIDDMPVATMTVIYDSLTSMRAFVNPDPCARHMMYSGPCGLRGDYRGCSVIGCGEIEPLFNHRGGSVLKVGDKVLLNGAVGKILRSSEEEESGFVQIEADMHDMDPRYMGGFNSPYGPLCVISIASVLELDHPVPNRESVVSDMGVPLPVSYRNNMLSKHWCSYGDVWPSSTEISVDRSRCLGCEVCQADRLCPMGASPSEGPDTDLCLSCGSCVSNCSNGVFSGDMGAISFDGRRVPVTIRLSSRQKAEELCIELKSMIDDGSW